MAEREGEDRLNDRKRPKIGVTTQEDVRDSSPHRACLPAVKHTLNGFRFPSQTLDREVTSLLRDDNFDAEDKSNKAWPHISRYDMIKSRLW